MIGFLLLLIAPLPWAAEKSVLTQAEQIREEIVVTADRNTQPLKHTGNSISVISKEQIENRARAEF